MSSEADPGACLRAAAAAGDVVACRRLLEKHGLLVQTRDELGRTALHLAAAAGRTSVARLLLDFEPGLVHAADGFGCTALQRAAADGHETAVRVLLDRGARPNARDALHGNGALHEAAWKGYSRTVKILASSGADLSLTNAAGFTALHLCCQNGHNQSCREILLAGGDADIRNHYGDAPLHTSARYGHAGVTRILISAECRLSEQNENGDTALHIAAAMGRRKLTRILLEAGCERTLRNKQAEAPLDIALRKGHQEIALILETVRQRRSRRQGKVRGRKGDPEAPAWSPYGCHYYPDMSAFPKPKLDTLPAEPLKKGEQYYLDLAGNIRKGPVGAGYTCYCAPLFRHMEEKLERDKQELKQHIDEAHARLGRRMAGLEVLSKVVRSEKRVRPKSPEPPPKPEPVEEPSRTVAEIVCKIQERISELPDRSQHSESSDDEDRPLRYNRIRGPMRDSNLAAPRNRAPLYNPPVEGLAELRLVEGDVDNNNDSGYSPSLPGYLDSRQLVGASSLV